MEYKANDEEEFVVMGVNGYVEEIVGGNDVLLDEEENVIELPSIQKREIGSIDMNSKEFT